MLGGQSYFCFEPKLRALMVVQQTLEKVLQKAFKCPISMSVFGWTKIAKFPKVSPTVYWLTLQTTFRTLCQSHSTAKTFTLLYKQAALAIFLNLLTKWERQQCEVFHSCSTAAWIRWDHMKSCRLYSRPGRENYSPALSTLALNLN